MDRIFLTLSAIIGLIGCAAQETAPESGPMMLPYLAPLDEAPFGVAEIKPPSDVADLTTAHRHVVFPRDSFPPLATLAAVPSTVRLRPPPPVEPEPLSVPQAQPVSPDDPVYAAWYKSRVGAPSMTAAGCQIIDTSANSWAEPCLLPK